MSGKRNGEYLERAEEKSYKVADMKENDVQLSVDTMPQEPCTIDSILRLATSPYRDLVPTGNMYFAFIFRLILGAKRNGARLLIKEVRTILKNPCFDHVYLCSSFS